MTDEGIFARIPLDQLTLLEAEAQVEDASWWHETRVAVLFHFPQVTVDGYWSLSVGDHREMVQFLDARGLL